MKKTLCALLLVALLVLSLPVLSEEALSGHAARIYDAIRWNVNLPKQSTVLHAEDYLFKLTKDITLNALLMEVSLSEDLQMMYGRGGGFMLIDLDSGEVIDYKTYDGNVRWPDGDVTSRYDALHLLYGGYWSYCEGYNENIMSMHEFITPLEQADVDAINAALTAAFIR